MEDAPRPEAWPLQRPARDGPGRLWPAVLGVALGVALVVALAATLLWRERIEVDRATRREARFAARTLAEHVERRVLSLERMALRWESGGGTPEAEWRADARRLAGDHVGLRALQRIGPDYRVRWIEPEGAGRPVGTDLSLEPDRLEALRQAERLDRATMSSVSRPDGELLTVVAALRVDGRPDGLIVGALDVDALVEEIRAELDGFTMAIYEGDRAVVGDGVAEGVDPARCADQAAVLRDVAWRIRLCPTPALQARLRSPLPEAALGVGLLLVGLTAGLAVQGRRLAWKVRQEEASRRETDRLNADLRRSAAEIETAYTELEAFSYSIAHDLRAPLRAIDGFGGLLAQEYAARLDDRGRGWLERMRANARRMALLIDDLLELSRVARAPMGREPVDVTAAVEDIVTTLARMEPSRHVTVRVAPGLRADADPGLLRVALHHLLHNAFKFTTGRPDARIEVAPATVDGQPGFLVRDNGVGFDMKYAHKLFSPFERIHGGEFEGTGIGLAIVDRVVRRHGGTVKVHAVPGEGAEFRVGFGPREPYPP